MSVLSQIVSVQLEVREMPCGHYVAAVAQRWAKYDEGASEDMKSVKCPEGHSWHLSESETQRLQKALMEAQRRTTEAEVARNQAVRDRDGALATLAQVKKRAESGVCQRCHRTFQNVQRHMARVHDLPSKTAGKPSLP